MDIDWNRYDTDPVYKAVTSAKIKESSRLATCVLVMVRAVFKYADGSEFSCFLMPWECLDEAARIAGMVRPNAIFLYAVGADGWYRLPGDAS